MATQSTRPPRAPKMPRARRKHSPSSSANTDARNAIASILAAPPRDAEPSPWPSAKELQSAVASLLAIAANYRGGVGGSLRSHAEAVGDAVRSAGLVSSVIAATAKLSKRVEQLQHDALWGVMVDWINKHGLERAPEAFERFSGTELTSGQRELLRRAAASDAADIRAPAGVRAAAKLRKQTTRAVYKAIDRLGALRNSTRMILSAMPTTLDPKHAFVRRDILRFVIVALFGHSEADCEAALRILRLDEDSVIDYSATSSAARVPPGGHIGFAHQGSI